MQRFVHIFVVFCLIVVGVQSVHARKVERKKPVSYTQPERTVLPPDLAKYGDSTLRGSAAVADTTHLGWWGFDGPGFGDPQGWTTRDLTVGLEGVVFHVADGTELDGGTSGGLLPLQGAQSMWCGVAAPVGVPFCSYGSLPGYGNNWKQILCSDALVCDSVRIYYDVFWDSEPGYDRTFVEYFDENANSWQALPVNSGAGFYESTGTADECLEFAVPSGETTIRFRFISDGAFSDEDGIFNTDGAVLLDSMTVQCFNGGLLSSTNYEDFESALPGDQTVGIWTAKQFDGFGDFAALYPGVNVLQNSDECFRNRSYLWGFFDDPMITNYACGGFPEQGAIPYGPNADGLYFRNAIESPLIPYVGSGDKVLLSYLKYADAPLDNLIFGTWAVRSWVGGCPTRWTNDGFSIAFENQGWIRVQRSIGALIDPAADFIQVQLGVVDACDFWCGVFGTGECHSHGYLYDEVHVSRINQVGPEFSVRHYDLFQDNFAEDGTLIGSARADMAQDIAPSASSTILPGDSISVTLHGVGTDPNTGVGPSAYVYLAVWPPNQLGKSPAELEAPETRAGIGKRYPFVGTVNHDGVTWTCFRMDNAVTTAGSVVDDKYCFDLNDTVFTPGDTICYVLAADDGAGNTNYWSRRLNGQGANFVTDDMWEALSSPLEFTILPAAGVMVQGDALYVDDADDRAGPPQLFFDTAFDLLGIRRVVDRYDVLGPSSNVGNSLASRVKSVATQIVGVYRGILWNSGNLSSGLIGDGTGNPEKSDDFSLLFTLLDSGGSNPGIYISGDDVAEEWVGLTGAGAVNLRAIYMNFNLVDGDHVNAGESVSPLLTATGPCFIELGVPNELIVYGGCPRINDFDVLETTGLSLTEFPYPGGSGDAVISQSTPNSNGTTARVILSGFSYHYIRDIDPGFPPARVTHLRNLLIWALQGIVQVAVGIAETAQSFLLNAAPNPFNPETTIRFGVRERGHVTLKVYNVAGQLVRTLVNEVKSPSPDGFEVTWNGRGDGGDAVASGVYFYKLTSPGFSKTRKMVLLK